MSLSLAGRNLDRLPFGGRSSTADIGTWLVADGILSQAELDRVRGRIERRGVRLADALGNLSAVDRGVIATVEARHYRTCVVDPVVEPADVRMVAALGPDTCLREGLLPWRRVGGCTLVLSSRPEEFARHMAHLTALFGPVRMAVAREDRLHRAVQMSSDTALAIRAEMRVTAAESSRTWNGPRNGLRLMLLSIPLLALAIWAPAASLFGLLLVATLFLVLSTALKVAAAIAALRSPPASTASPVIPASRPVVSLLVPLFREREIAAHLLSRLMRLDYPQELLDICLVLEVDDRLTREAVRDTILPPWVRTITVPHGTLKTKPRALNYALDFVRGSIVGVYDAEDAPAPDQINAVVARFAQRGPQVACIQGMLDYYNPRTNWFTRCFTLEYATWFRLVLPGLERLGLVVPLGGTTLFFRREALERIGAWDAHNVTEDADLGLRLARHGYHTDVLETVTEEEANGRLLPWVRQRSRWLKGYAMTYAVHMRRPAELWRDLGPWRFLGVQALFLGTVVQFLLAPLLWACWWILSGVGVPFIDGVPHRMILGLTLLFLAAEAVSLVITSLAVRRAGKPWLALWAPTLMLYFPLATAAMYKGLWELFVKPFYWDKTAHGIFQLPEAAGTQAEATRPPPPPRRRA